MLIRDNANVTTGTILGPDGTPAEKPVLTLSPREATLLRQYKKFLEKYHLREALYCDDCFDGDMADGCRAFVTDNQIGILCHCKMRVFAGSTH